ncbi:Ferrous-iron efflux pump FieF [Roseovarius sp. THAF8]|uniref:cation diffusion facilitator family transporter n=1 Tax=Roseovarius sp. THAF8 TaxID=2587846 RepID=UPI001267BE42|nr:cation diffusion facilitator family transporter [Roseovarius sp. THAF8]QFT98081.1 Ferrous-iron efflux pump FieF [Roseovarius sp. THAF8]
MSTTLRLAMASILVGAIVLAIKSLAWWLTGSVALLSDALESTVNVATAIAALIAIRIAAIPADSSHPYGHHKAEFFSAVLEGVMIIIAALVILREAYRGFLDPAALDMPIEGLLINGAATVINALWAWVLVTRGRANSSPALVADGRHLWTDVVTSAGVALGVLLAMITGWWMLDPIMAAIVAVNILWSGSRVVRESLSGLMDEAVSDETLDTVREIIATEAGGAVEAHDLRTRHAGPAIFIDFHLVVPGDTTVFDAHEICDRVEAALKQAVEGARITIHVEPEHKQKHSGIVVLD